MFLHTYLLWSNCTLPLTLRLGIVFQVLTQLKYRTSSSSNPPLTFQILIKLTKRFQQIEFNELCGKWFLSIRVSVMVHTFLFHQRAPPVLIAQLEWRYLSERMSQIICIVSAHCNNKPPLAADFNGFLSPASTTQQHLAPNLWVERNMWRWWLQWQGKQLLQLVSGDK